MNKETIAILMSVLSAPFLGGLVSRYFDRNKTRAETQNINIGGEDTINKSWERFGLQQEKLREELRKEFTDKFNALQTSYNKIATDYLDLQKDFKLMKEEFEEVKVEKERLAQENLTLIERVKSLETQVSTLQDEVNKYKGVGNHIAEIVHSKVNEIQDELSQ